MVRWYLSRWVVLVLCTACSAACGAGAEPDAGAADTRTLIITKGGGGDASGARVLQSTWGGVKPDLLNLSSESAEHADLARYRCVLVVGQGAIQDMAQAASATAKLSGRTVGLYAHVIDEAGLALAKALRGRGALNLFFTDSQLALLRLRNASAYAMLRIEPARVWSAPLALDTTLPPRSDEDGHADTVLAAADHVIWLGGNYTDGTGKPRVLTTGEIVAALRPLRGFVEPGASVAVMLTPRLFDRAMSDADKRARLAAIRSVFDGSPVTYHGSASLVAELQAAGVSLQAAPPYAVLMRLPWSPHTRHYASADQFNLFADFKPPLTPFLLDPTDLDQAAYALDYLRGAHASLTDALRLHGCDQ
ncbi:PI-PLC domain-containing protein [Burkholderia alba]|uniref:hypothetical protein n=1 Tax=Burkholderia alba TaxID=2683677 RepID=UPI002B053D31|nr:hypothetical protein [Burkholderia alba]